MQIFTTHNLLMVMALALFILGLGTTITGIIILATRGLWQSNPPGLHKKGWPKRWLAWWATLRPYWILSTNWYEQLPG